MGVSRVQLESLRRRDLAGDPFGDAVLWRDEDLGGGRGGTLVRDG